MKIHHFSDDVDVEALCDKTVILSFALQSGVTTRTRHHASGAVLRSCKLQW